jgi:hypothetical protein
MGQLVFLTYSYKDIRRVRRFRDLLKALGFDVWPDTTLTPGTSSWKSHIDNRLNDTVVMLVFLSRYTSESNYVHEALAQAHTRQLPVLPLLIDGDPGHLLLVQTEGESWFDLRWSWNYRREIEELVDTLQQFATPVVLT